MELPPQSEVQPDIYDENSVFRNLLAKETTSQPTPRPNRLDLIFKDAPSQEPPITVGDFLPQI
ncbi:hypothetical protein [Hellea balneolensis]|uniref:hypothetical protein n=1 Tax=Hellea balneolensis TaxID=287478 RepID=UPI000415B1F2|nr:hypothetical protein [Hellea balneolensis]